MRKLFFIFIASIAVLSSLSEAYECMYSRTEAVKCMLNYVDKNRDGVVAYHELKYFQNTYLNADERLHFEEENDLFESCDSDKNHLLSQKDFDDTVATCLVHCDTLTNFMEMVCINAIQEFIDRTGHA